MPTAWPNWSDSNTLRRLGERVCAALSSEFPNIRPHLGSDYVNSNDPQAAGLRTRGAHFAWVAFAFEPVPMWDYHFGVLASHGLELGLHISAARFADPPAEVLNLARQLSAEYRYDPGSAEHQFQLAGMRWAEEGFDEVVTAVVNGCRAAGGLAPLLASVQDKAVTDDA